MCRRGEPGQEGRKALGSPRAATWERRPPCPIPTEPPGCRGTRAVGCIWDGGQPSRWEPRPNPTGSVPGAGTASDHPGAALGACGPRLCHGGETLGCCEAEAGAGPGDNLPWLRTQLLQQQGLASRRPLRLRGPRSVLAALPEDASEEQREGEKRSEAAEKEQRSG